MSILFDYNEDPTRSPKGRSRSRHPKDKRYSNQSTASKYDNLLVFGYQCKLFRDTQTAEAVNKGKQLIPWMGNKDLMIDRYDCRGHLYRLEEFDFENKISRELTPEEMDIENICDEERYMDLKNNMFEENILREEEEKRSKALYDPYTAYQSIGYSYEDDSSDGKSLSDYAFSNDLFVQYCQYYGYDHNDPNVNAYFQGQSYQYDYERPPPPPEPPSAPTQQETEFKEPERFLPPEGLEIPDNIEVPETRKMQSIMEKTAVFISKQTAQMEIVLKTKQAGNPQFSFLYFDNYLNPYYKFILGKIKEGIYVPPAEKEKEIGKESEKGKEAKKDTDETKINSHKSSGKEGNAADDNDDDNDDSDDDDDNGHELHPLLQAHRRPLVKRETKPKILPPPPLTVTPVMKTTTIGRVEDLAKVYMTMKYKSNPDPEEIVDSEIVDSSCKGDIESEAGSSNMIKPLGYFPSPPPPPGLEISPPMNVPASQSLPPPPPPPTGYSSFNHSHNDMHPPYSHRNEFHPIQDQFQQKPPTFPRHGDLFSQVEYVSPRPYLARPALLPPGVDLPASFSAPIPHPDLPMTISSGVGHPRNQMVPFRGAPPPPPPPQINPAMHSVEVRCPHTEQAVPSYGYNEQQVLSEPQVAQDRNASLLPPGVEETMDKPSLPPPPPLPPPPSIEDIKRKQELSPETEPSIATESTGMLERDSEQEREPQNITDAADENYVDEVEIPLNTEARSEITHVIPEERYKPSPLLSNILQGLPARSENDLSNSREHLHHTMGEHSLPTDRHDRLSPNRTSNAFDDYERHPARGDDLLQCSETGTEFNLKQYSEHISSANKPNINYEDDFRDSPDRYIDDRERESDYNSPNRYSDRDMYQNSPTFRENDSIQNSPHHNTQDINNSRDHYQHHLQTVLQQLPLQQPLQPPPRHIQHEFQPPPQPSQVYQQSNITSGQELLNKSPFDYIVETLKTIQHIARVIPDAESTRSKQPSDKIVPPSPDLQPVIDRLALYVARNGEEFETGIKDKKDPRFDFLNPWNMYHNYYLGRKQTYVEEIEKEKKEDEERKKNLKVSFGLKTKVKPVLMVKKKAVVTAASVFNQNEDEDEEQKVPEGFKPNKDPEEEVRRKLQKQIEEKEKLLRQLHEQAILQQKINEVNRQASTKAPLQSLTPQQQALLKRKAQTEHLKKDGPTSSKQSELQDERRKKVASFVGMLKKAAAVDEPSSSADEKAASINAGSFLRKRHFKETSAEDSQPPGKVKADKKQDAFFEAINQAFGGT